MATQVEIQAAKQLLEENGFVCFKMDSSTGDLVGNIRVTQIPKGIMIMGTALDNCLKGDHVRIIT